MNTDAPTASPQPEADTQTLPIVSFTPEALNRKPSDTIIEPRDYFDLYGRHIVQNVVIEGGKPTNLLRYTIIDRFVIKMPGQAAKAYEVSAPMNGFKGSRKEAFLQYDKFLEEYRVVYEKEMQDNYAKFVATKAAAIEKMTEGKQLNTAEQKPISKILGADGHKVADAKVEVPAHDPTLAERHVEKNGPARIERP